MYPAVVVFHGYGAVRERNRDAKN